MAQCQQHGYSLSFRRCPSAIRLKRRSVNSGSSTRIGDPLARKRNSTRLGDVAAMVHASRSAGSNSKPDDPSSAQPGDAPEDAITRKRQLVAGLCRLLGEQRVAGKPSRSRPAAPLAPRQRQTLELLLDGKSEKEIAHHLSISRHTVHVYVKMLYKRFGVSSRGELLARWVQRG